MTRDYVKFEVSIRRQIPIITNLLFWIIAILVLILCVFYFVMSPTDKQSDEMATAYFFFVIPDILKKIFGWAFLGLIVFIPLYYIARLKLPALFYSADQNLYLTAKNIHKQVSYSQISKIYFNDLHDFSNRPKGIVQIIIREKNGNTTSFRLKNYEDGDAIMKILTEIPNIEVSFFDRAILTDDEA